MNNHHDTIKFTATWSTEEVVFLDTRVYLKNQHIETDLYVKPTDNHQYLHMNSCHPRHCKSAIPFRQALRLRRICSEKENLQRRTEELEGYLANRGHPKEHLKAEIDRAVAIPREECLQLQQREKSNRIPLVITYNPTLPPVGGITRKHHNILHASERLKKAIPSPPIIAFRRPKNLRDLLVRATLKPSAPQETRSVAAQDARPVPYC